MASTISTNSKNTKNDRKKCRQRGCHHRDGKGISGSPIVDMTKCNVFSILDQKKNNLDKTRFLSGDSERSVRSEENFKGGRHTIDFVLYKCDYLDIAGDPSPETIVFTRRGRGTLLL
jgi:hypothetical protein